MAHWPAHGRAATIVVIGAGAVGGYYGARLIRAGHDVHFLLRSDYQIVKREGLLIRSRDGDFHLGPSQVHVYDDPNALPPADLVIVALKTTYNHLLEPLIRPVVKQDTAILTLQNGLGNEERLADLFGPHRIFGGVAFVCINRVAPGVIQHIDHGLIQLGEFEGCPGDRARAIARMFRGSGVACDVLDDLRSGRWGKLVWNIPFNGLGAVLDLSTDRLIENESGVQIVRTLMQEVIAAAEAVGAKMPADAIERQLRNTRTMGAYRSSMQTDRQQGRPLEVEAIIGEPLRQARSAGVPTPMLEMLYHLTRLVDGQKTPALHELTAS